jgi:hypothetical protein
VDGGACATAGLDPEMFFPDMYDDDTPIPVPSKIKELCELDCPFRVGCLAWAMANDAYGFWAGTSRFQRLQLGRDQHRVKCPGCSSPSVMADRYGETCLSCGISWRI